VLTVDVVSHHRRRRVKIRLGLVVAGLVAAGTASLPTLLGPEASAGQPPFTTNPTGTAAPSETATKPTGSPSVRKCIPDYTDNNWCAPGR
jgi:hypothetical protein